MGFSIDPDTVPEDGQWHVIIFRPPHDRVLGRRVNGRLELYIPPGFARKRRGPQQD